MSKVKHFITLISILVAAAAIRIVLIHNWHGLSFDEIASVSVALRPLKEMWQYLQWEMHPPLHFIFLHFWIKLFGASEFIIRLSSVITGVCAMLATYALNKELFKNPTAGLYGAILSGFIFLTFFYSLVARMYILFFLLAVLSFYFLLRAISQKKYILWWLYGFTTLLAVYTHLTAAIIPVIQLLYVWYLYRKELCPKSVIRKVFYISSTIAIAYLPWFISFVTKRLDAFGANAWYTFTQADKVFFLSIPSSLIVGNPDVQIIPLLAALVCALVIWVTLFKVTSDQNTGWHISSRLTPAAVLGFLILYLPTIALFLIDLNSLRFYFLPVIGLIILLTQAMLYIQTKKIRLLIHAALLATLLYPLATVANIPDIRWPDVAEFIETREQPTDTIVTGYSADLLALEFYYDGNLPISTFADPQMIKESKNSLELVIRTNSIIYVNQERMDEFAKLIGNQKRIFFLFSKTLFGRSYEAFTDWFIQNGWQVVDTYSENNFSSPTVWLLEKN